MAKGLDNKFLHYGIRKEDLSMIEAICDAEQKFVRLLTLVFIISNSRIVKVLCVKAVGAVCYQHYKKSPSW